MKHLCRFPLRLFLGSLLVGYFGSGSPRQLAAAELHVGAATVDITPDEPVALDGQRLVRISKTPATRIYAAVLALQSREGDRVLDQAVMVSCDLVAIRQGVLVKVRDKLADRAPDLDRKKLFLSATHTHTAPVTTDGKYVLPETGIMQPGAYADWMAGRVADGVVFRGHTGTAKMFTEKWGFVRIPRHCASPTEAVDGGFGERGA